MQILMIGLSHHTADVALREKFNLSAPAIEQLYQSLRKQNPHVEIVAITTCNRTEVYIARQELAYPKREQLQGALAKCCGVDSAELDPVAQSRKGDEAVRHLFEVACGLDSMVLGEPQILGQIKRAYDAANAQQVVGPILHRVFQEAITAAKAARRQTGIDEGRMSVGSVAADFARQIFSHFDDKTILAVGAGDMAKVTLRHLHKLEPAKLYLTNRSAERAAEVFRSLGLHDQPNAHTRRFDDLDELLVDADIVLTSTGAPHPIITVERFKNIHRKRKSRPLFVIDIALPRDVEPGVGDFADVYVYNIDDLQRVVSETQGSRCALVQDCRDRINESVRVCMSRIQHRDVGQLIRQLRNQLRDLGDVEKQRSLRKLENLSPDELNAQLESIIDEHTHRLINKILHIPMTQLDQKNADAPLGFAAAALRHLFQLEDSHPNAENAAEPTANAAPDVENHSTQEIANPQTNTDAPPTPEGKPDSGPKSGSLGVSRESARLTD